MKYFASFRRFNGTDYRVKLDGRWSMDRMRREALKIAQRREHHTQYRAYSIERESSAIVGGAPFAMTLPQALRYPIHI